MKSMTNVTNKAKERAEAIREYRMLVKILAEPKLDEDYRAAWNQKAKNIKSEWNL